MTVAIIIPKENYNLDVLRTLMVNVKPAVSDVYVVENNVNKNQLIKSGVIFIDESNVDNIIVKNERKFIFEDLVEDLLRVNYLELEKDSTNGIFKVKDGYFKLISSEEESEEHDAIGDIQMTCQVKLTLNKKRRFYGPGTAQLLNLIERTQSVKSAATSMNISYSKALQMIRTVEKGLGYQVVEKKQGGTGGGESFLTEEGKAFARKYVKFNLEVEECVREIFKKYWQ
ncbi:ModE molybdate transport repressor domain-containing protein [Peptoniphilus asaccharolyticus DSM 20463]|uniref:ModE molybdate transport repressor domain-containing protein n=1 Tax=Peptoniphilus asaccharolyticus DSM 20463 TaxID=573058 RepID=A0A1W1VB65_PEPAS|nr:LysR family transcriptional regulator [Peptoniphilus asaccharolyticus]MBL7575702.1 LysR family transcriptional regulator [Peptoniphilus asaccharolyticus]SMB90463.1 ModE molybdate transport repressor domain-containing protein [Peptoniphilus asaccharolyticus DSM 20463]